MDCTCRITCACYEVSGNLKIYEYRDKVMTLLYPYSFATFSIFLWQKLLNDFYIHIVTV